jgi:hypothetical protein
LVIFDSGCSQKNGKLRIYVDFKKLNVATKKDLYMLHFNNEVINTVVGHEFIPFWIDF